MQNLLAREARQNLSKICCLRRDLRACPLSLHHLTSPTIPARTHAVTATSFSRVYQSTSVHASRATIRALCSSLWPKPCAAVRVRASLSHRHGSLCSQPTFLALCTSASAPPGSCPRAQTSAWRPPHTLTEFGSPLSRATPPSTPDSRSTLSSTVVDTPPGALQDDQEVREVAPPTPGAHVTKDPEHPYMSTPARANQVTTTTPADSAKKAGDNDDYPINLN